jgi:NifU-like protein involved in Fe-S cluster formation
MAYSEKLLEHFKHPKNVGTLDKSKKSVGTGLVGAPECGDVMRLQIEVDDETGMIKDAKFKTFGCGSAIASSSLATEWLKGKSVDRQHGNSGGISITPSKNTLFSFGRRCN